MPQKAFRSTATFSRPADNTAYAAGDIIANSGTAASVVPLSFPLQMPGNTYSGRILGASCIVTPASGNLVITALDFDLLVFRGVTGVPFADAGYPADNAAMAITAAAFADLVAVYRFANGAWRNPAGALTAGATGYQAVAAQSGLLQVPYFNSGQNLTGVVQAQGAWTPTGVVNAFTFSLFCDAD